MNNKIVYFDEKFPQYYMSGSRDFQLLARLLTLVLNSSKVEADSLLYLNDALLINDRLLPLLQTKVGFWTNREFTNDELRLTCDVFDLLVREKGSRNGIVKSIETYLRTIGLATDFDILIINKDIDGNNIYEIQIGINALWHDYTLLKEILKYILPTGYIFKIFFYDKVTVNENDLLYSDCVLVAAGSNYRTSKIVGSYYTSTGQEWNQIVAKIVNVDGSTYKGLQSIDMTRISSGNNNEKDETDE